MAIYEICVENYREAIKGESLGANRIELCDNLKEDGTTPSYGTIKNVIRDTKIPVMVIIRPRGGDFCYSKEEVSIMLEDIEVCKKLGAKGVVIGALKDKKIDLQVTKALVEKAKPMNITFHMAFDEIEDKKEALEELIALGVNRVLTKGGKENAMAGRDVLKELKEYARDRIIIMPGKGVTKENRDYLLEYIGVNEIHGTKVV